MSPSISVIRWRLRPLTCLCGLKRFSPPSYRKRAICYSDLWDSYGAVLPSKRHRAVSKASGQTAHIERFNNTLRQRCANLVRKTLSFSKDERPHQVLFGCSSITTITNFNGSVSWHSLD